LVLLLVSNVSMRHLLLCTAFLMVLCSVAASQDLRVASRNRLSGYVDSTGTWTIEPRFLEASEWEDGAARVRLSNGDFAFIDARGEYLMQPRRLQRLGYLSDGLAVFEPEGQPGTSFNNVGFIDIKGRVVISPHFYAAYDFSEGVAAASVEFGKCGYIDKRGKFVIRPTFDFPSYENCGPFSEGLAHVMKDGKYGYINHAGAIEIPPHYDYAFDFSEGFAVVGVGSKYGYIDKQGTELGSLSYSYARGYAEGFAAVAVVDKWGFINQSGALVIPARYEEVGDFSEGLAWIQMNGKRGYINSYGDLVVPPQYDDATDYWNGMAEVVQYRRSESATKIRIVIDKAGIPVPLRNK
jgi:WG containing repeat